jgi:hypothetical protein
MADVPALMKRCQIGVPRGPNAYDDLHSILAECYGTLGSLGAENARLREAIRHYEAALKEVWPEGAQGRTLDHWNAARIAIHGSQP